MDDEDDQNEEEDCDEDEDDQYEGDYDDQDDANEDEDFVDLEEEIDEFCENDDAAEKQPKACRKYFSCKCGLDPTGTGTSEELALRHVIAALREALVRFKTKGTLPLQLKQAKRTVYQAIIHKNTYCQLDMNRTWRIKECFQE